MFEPLSRYVRAKRGYPANWFVYEVDGSNLGKIKLTGSLVRPVDPAYEPHIGRPFDWIKPSRMKRSMTISRELYERIYKP
jgi:hypothetical protein